MSSPSRKRARAVTGSVRDAFDQYSMPVPSGNPNSIRRPDMTSSIAYSSATRFGVERLSGIPATMILIRLRARDHVAGPHARRGHQAERRVVVLVEADAVVAELLDQHDLAGVALVELMRAHRVELAVRHVHPARREPPVVPRDVRVVVAVHDVELDVVEHAHVHRPPGELAHCRRRSPRATVGDERPDTASEAWALVSLGPQPGPGRQPSPIDPLTLAPAPLVRLSHTRALV